jgi:hypothetical protein
MGEYSLLLLQWESGITSRHFPGWKNSPVLAVWQTSNLQDPCQIKQYPGIPGQGDCP